MVKDNVHNCDDSRDSIATEKIEFLEVSQLSRVVPAKEDKHNIESHAEYPDTIGHHEPDIDQHANSSYGGDLPLDQDPLELTET